MGMPKYSEVPLVEVLIDGEIHKIPDLTEVVQKWCEREESEEKK